MSAICSYENCRRFLTANGWRSSMAEDKKKEIDVAVIEVTEEYLKEKLYKIRGKRVLLDADFAHLGAEYKAFDADEVA